MPLEYINQNAFFFEHNFYVDSNVLIPRFETELLVEEAVDFLLRYKQSKSVYEVGVGSGAVILSILAKIDRPLETFASDISEGALEVTRKNYFRLKNCFHPKSKLELKLTDRLTKEINKFDLIISNPPYIKLDKDSAKVHQQVLKFEPECALFLVDDQYNDWFSTLFNQVNSCLNEEGVFLMEGHEDHLGELETIAKNYFAFTKLKKDLSGQLRFLQAAKKEF